ncbi:hypothetical protein OF83DRAFT_890346 [Amylostereum chailletii]|nr:hypothetical protein OF83DRAFT_890346 [Amylostereum chailletii]
MSKPDLKHNANPLEENKHATPRFSPSTSGPAQCTPTTTETSQEYQAMSIESEWTDLPLGREYPDEENIFTTQPRVRPHDTLDTVPDGWAQCLISDHMDRQIADYPNFPQPLERPPTVRHEVREAATGGLGVFALENLEAGDLVLMERPLIVTPHSERIHRFNRTYYSPGEKAALLRAHYAERERRAERLVDRMDPILRERFYALANCHLHDDRRGRIYNIIGTNAFCALTDSRQIGPLGEYTAVGNDISRFNHSCCPNVSYSFDDASFGIEIRAMRSIRAGEEMFVKYIDILEPFAERREALARYGFRCACAACSDPVASDERRAKYTGANFPMDNALSLDKCLEAVEALEKEGLEATRWYLQWVKDVAEGYAEQGDKEKAEEWRRKVCATALGRGGRAGAARLANS